MLDFIKKYQFLIGILVGLIIAWTLLGNVFFPEAPEIVTNTVWGILLLPVAAGFFYVVTYIPWRFFDEMSVKAKLFKRFWSFLADAWMIGLLPMLIFVLVFIYLLGN
jgi:hypothetical protein